MRRFALSFIILLSVWILTTGRLSYEELVLGSFVSLAIAQLVYKFMIPRRGELNIVDRLISMLKFLVVLFVEEVKAHSRVTKAIITGDINPGLMRMKKPFKSEIANYFVLNGITFTPGTLTVVADDNDNVVVHCLDIEKTREPGSGYMDTFREVFE